MKEVQTEASEKLANEFLSNLKAALGQKRVKFGSKLIRRHSRLYRFHIKNETRFLFIHANHGKHFFEVPSPGQEISRYISSEDMDWAIILLRESEGEKHPLGFLIRRDEFMKMKVGFTMNRMGLIKIKEKYLASKYQFNNWDNFFHLLDL
jgi:hypothetical protein